VFSLGTYNCYCIENQVGQ